MDKLTNDARIYSDVQGLERLRYQTKSNSPAVTHEVAQQFSAMLMQMVMRSMRDANNAIASDLFGSNDQMDYYQDMFDKQLTLLPSDKGNSFAQMIEKNLSQQYGIGKTTADSKDKKPLAFQAHKPGAAPMELPLPSPKHLALAPLQPTPATRTQPTVVSVTEQAPKPEPSMFSSPEQFVKNLWPSAKQAANAIGTDPRILLAQAALETSWGKKILSSGKETSTHNLFNIKADNGWNQNTATVDTLEQKNGVLAKEKATFRSYDSFVDSFKDYVSFLKNNDRYSDALSKAANPGQFMHALQRAGFATDHQYADKILKIFSSPMFKNIVDKME
jgi:flagellar protein FlgJ